MIHDNTYADYKEIGFTRVLLPLKYMGNSRDCAGLNEQQVTSVVNNVRDLIVYICESSDRCVCI